MAVIDPTRTWEALENRLTETTNERHRVVLRTVIDHMKAECNADLDALMATVAANPEYHFWSSGTDDFGPKGFDLVRGYYADFVASRTNVLEFEVTRLIVDDNALVTEGLLEQIYPGAAAAGIGIPVDDESADYLVVFRQLLVWPIDENGLVLGEDSYCPGVVSVTKLSAEDLPQAYIAMMAAPPDMSDTIAAMLLDRVGDERPGLRTRERDWTWDEVVAESAARGAIAQSLRRDGPFHIGVLLENVPDCQLIVTDTAGVQRLGGLDLGLEADRFLVVDTDGYREAVAAHQLAPGIAAGVDADSVILLLFTSGTTGASKAVKCSQGRLAAIALAAADKFGHVRDDVEYCCMPLFHGNAIMALWAPALSVGATVCLTRAFSASGFLSDVRYFGATFFTYVGKALGYLMATPEQPDDADNTLQRGFGTEASPDDQAEFRRRFDAELFEGYGSSEGGGGVAIAPDAPAGALGRPAHPGVAIVDFATLKDCVPAVFDQHGGVLNPEDAVGEIVDKFGTRTFEGCYESRRLGGVGWGEPAYGLSLVSRGDAAGACGAGGPVDSGSHYAGRRGRGGWRGDLCAGIQP